ncbi:amidohydrolase family protein [Streptodolium elevatio]
MPAPESARHTPRAAVPQADRTPHPVVDGDGHIVEALPVLTEVIRKVAGPDAADHFLGSSPTYASRSSTDGRLAELTGDQRRPGTWIPPWWSLPGNTLDRATAFLPALLHERMDEIGLDFAVLYPSVGLVASGHPDDAIRAGACRGVNTYLAELTDGLQDRMTPAAVVPTHTPDEAIAELEHAVGSLGFKAVLVNNIVARPVPGGPAGARWYDVLALDSVHDYDPLWRRCVELGVAVTVHTPTMGIGLRQSSTRYVHNHIGTFAAGGEAFAKALVIGGVAHRFPTLNFAFLEGGVSWGVQLLADLVGHWEKRGGPNIAALDPAGLDAALWDDLFARHGGTHFAAPGLAAGLRGQADNPPPDLDDYRGSGIASPADIARMFERFYFGCEADDPTIAWAYADSLNPCGAVLRPLLGSDIGHWDVTDMREVVGEARELVEHGHLTPAQFREFACDNTVRLHGGMNPRFFDGTRVEQYARKLLGHA